MARSGNRRPSPAAALAKAGKAAEAEVPPLDMPRFVRLVGSGSYSDGVFLPAGRALEVGVEIPERMARARLAAETAEAVLEVAITAKRLREGFAAFEADLRHHLTAAAAAVGEADDANLAEVVGELLVSPASLSVAVIDGLKAAIEAHTAALAAQHPDDGTGSASAEPPGGKGGDAAS